MKHFLSILLFAAVLSLCVPAQAGIIEFFFPALRKPEYDPMKTLRAPFAEAPAGNVAEDAQKGLPENAIPVNQPHVSNEEIGSWLVTALSEVLTFEGEPQDEAENRQYFIEGGWDQYVSFLEESGLNKIRQSGKFDIRSFAREAPLLLNEGVVDGRYRWLYEVPMMMSYLNKNVTSYKKVDPVNQMVVITVQIGRVADPDAAQSVLIERWSAKIQKAGQK